MRMSAFALMTALPFAMLAGTANAQDTGQAYVGAGYTYLDSEFGDSDAINLRAGYDFSDNFGAETEILIGVDSLFDYGVGFFGKAQYPVSEEFELFARAGYVFAEDEFGFDYDGVAFGAGGEIAFAGPNAIRIEYTRYELDYDVDANGFSVSYIRGF